MTKKNFSKTTLGFFSFFSSLILSYCYYNNYKNSCLCVCVCVSQDVIARLFGVN